jgi:hypothetical protein
MAFCPECGKPVTAEASKCASCGHALEAKPAAAKAGAGRFKGTMMMSTASVATKSPADAAAPAIAAPAVVASPATAPATPAASAPGIKAQAKSTMIGTGIGAQAGAAAVRPANQGLPAKPIAAAAANPAAPAPVARAAAPNAAGVSPKSTVLGAGIAPVAAAAAAHAATPAAAPIAASAAAAAAQASAARPVAQPAPATPADEPKRNLAFEQTQHHGAFTPARAAPVATAPRVAAAETFDPHAETDPPPPDSPEPKNARDEMDGTQDDTLDAGSDSKFLPGDPMGPQQPVAARAPMLRYDDSLPRISRRGGQDKKWFWIAAGAIVFACLGLVIMLASRMGH